MLSFAHRHNGYFISFWWVENGFLHLMRRNKCAMSRNFNFLRQTRIRLHKKHAKLMCMLLYLPCQHYFYFLFTFLEKFFSFTYFFIAQWKFLQAFDYFFLSGSIIILPFGTFFHCWKISLRFQICLFLQHFCAWFCFCFYFRCLLIHLWN